MMLLIKYIIFKKINEVLQVFNKILLYFSEKYRNKIKKLQLHLSTIENKKVNIPDRELVACSIAAKSKKIGVWGTSHRLLNRGEYHQNILKALNSLGEIGKSSNLGSKNVIGKCAEIKAANNILKNDTKATISDIEFTPAIRPRTGEPMKRCNNCIHIFGNE